MDDYTNKQGSKVSRFFEWLFGIVVVNLLTIFLSIFVLTLFPAFTAAYATIDSFKENGASHLLKTYFMNFKKYLEKSFLIGLFVIIILAVAGFSMYFYKTRFDVDNWIGQAGFWAMGLVMFLVIFFSLHTHLIMINFPTMTLLDTIRMSIFISFRYILSSLVLLAMVVLMVIGFIAFPIWILFGISLPILLSIKLTGGTYFYLRKIDLAKIMENSRRIEEGEDDDE